MNIKVYSLLVLLPCFQSLFFFKYKKKVGGGTETEDSDLAISNP